MDPHGLLLRALYDPGKFLPRHDDYTEPLHRWQARAALEALALAGYDLTPKPGARITDARITDGRFTPPTARERNPR